MVSESDPLDRPATPEEIEMVERLLLAAGIDHYPTWWAEVGK